MWQTTTDLFIWGPRVPGEYTRSIDAKHGVLLLGFTHSEIQHSCMEEAREQATGSIP